MVANVEHSTVSARRRKSQEALDTRIALVPRAHKLMVAAFVVVLLAAMIWGIVGSIPTTVKGDGIILLGGQQMFVVEGSGNGTIAAIRIGVGETVMAGAVVAEIRQTDLEARIAEAKEYLSTLERDQQHRAARLQADLKAHEDDAAEQLSLISSVVDDVDKNPKAQLRVVDLKIEAVRIRSTLADVRARVGNQLEDGWRAVEEQKIAVDRLESRRDFSKYARAPVAGTVQQIFVGIGQSVTPGSELMAIASEGEGFEVMAFLRPDNARRAEKGMPVHVVPSTVKEAEFGTMRGEVALVDDAPISAKAINAMLRDPQLVALLIERGGPYMARIKLSEQPGNASGFTWWSGTGPPFRVSPGTLATVDIVIGEKAPIAMVLPALRELLGL